MKMVIFHSFLYVYQRVEATNHGWTSGISRWIPQVIHGYSKNGFGTIEILFSAFCLV